MPVLLANPFGRFAQRIAFGHTAVELFRGLVAGTLVIEDDRYIRVADKATGRACIRQPYMTDSAWQGAVESFLEAACALGSG